MVEAGAEFCPECGAPVSDEPSSEGSDSAIYPELARANLLRMRGDYAQAEEVCLKILHRFPNNASANSLLGDICAERNDLEQAAEWYELALDITPDAQAVRQKLASAKERMRQREAANTAQQLGLPTSKSKAGLWIGLVVLFLIGTGALAYYIGQRVNQNRTASNAIVDAPVVLEPKPAGAFGGGAATTTGTAAQPDQIPQGRIDDDRRLTQLLAPKSSDGARLLEARQDPRSKSVVLSFFVQDGEDVRSMAARLAASALQELPDCRLVTVRAVRAGTLALIADVHRDAVVATASTEWQEAHKNDPAAFANAVLANEWPAQTPSPDPGVEPGAEPPARTDGTG